MNLDAEEALLGAMLLDSFLRGDDAIERACEVVGPGDFYRRSHGLIFAAARALRERGEPSDAITVTGRLERDGDLEAAGGKEHIFELAALATNASNSAHYARLVRDAGVRRALITAGEGVARLGWEGQGDPADLVEQAERAVFDLAAARRETEMIPLRDTVPPTIDRVREMHERGSDVVGLPTGWEQLDRLTSGLQPGNLVVVAGRPSMGKTALALSIARRTAVTEKLPVGLFTMEMNRHEVTQRLLALDGMIDLQKIRNGKLDREEWRRLNDSSQRLMEAPLHIEDAPLITPAEIRSRSRRLARAYPDLALILVDYLQLTTPPRQGERREQEVAQASRSFKALAGELGVPIVVLSQLSRLVEGRHDKRPMLSDLRESGAIEQDADVVLLLYRHEYYFPDEPETQGTAEVDVAKQRNGPTGCVQLAFVKRYARFSDLPLGAPR
jgi:replicative DNA helicase